MIRCVVRSLLVFLVVGVNQAVQAQSGEGTYRTEVGTVVTPQVDVPFWLHANQNGLIDPGSSGAYARIAVQRDWPRGDRFSVSTGLDLITRVSGRSTIHFSEVYVAARAGFLRAYAGRMHEGTGTTDEVLSSGALGTSRNATPVPKIAVFSDGYLDVPLSQGYVQVKGAWSEGWLGSSRFVENPRLHQKTAYMRLGGSLPVGLYGGLVHNALWGGTSPREGRLPSSFGDYLRTIVALNGGEDAPKEEQMYIQGDHLGVYDIGLEVQLGAVDLLAYRHVPYEDRDNLKLKSPQDGLLGVSVRWDVGLLQRIAYEYLYTKWQNGPIAPSGRGGPGGRDDYYNHGIYLSGWTYHGRTIGSPLLTPTPDTKNGHRGIENNRVVGHHLGLSGALGAATQYRLLATYTRNYGTYRDPFKEQRDQWSFLFEMQGQVSDRYGLELLGAVAVDRGTLYRNSIGVRVGLVQRGAAVMRGNDR